MKWISLIIVCLIVLLDSTRLNNAVVITSTVAATTNDDLVDDNNGLIDANNETTDITDYYFGISDDDDNDNDTITTTIEPFAIRYHRFIDTNPNQIEIVSPNYPDPYPVNIHREWSETAEGGTGVDVVVHLVDIDATKDILFIRGGDANSLNEKTFIFTGKMETEQRFRFLHTNQLFISFKSGQTTVDHPFTGFVITYVPYNEPFRATDPPTTDRPIDIASLQYLTRSVVVHANDQNPVTWEIFRDILTQSANEFIPHQNISALEAQRESVIFKYIKPCPETWRDIDTCIQIDFAIALILIDEDDGELEDDMSMYELSKTNLEIMWNEFAVKNFEAKGFKIYNNDTSDLLLVWIGISVGIVFVFLLVLYGIWKIDIFQDYRRMSSAFDGDDKRKSEIDISMFPAPYQNVPTLFPSTDGYAQFSTPTYGFMDSSPHSYDDKVYENEFKKSVAESVAYDTYARKSRVEFGPVVRIPSSQASHGIEADDDLEVKYEASKVQRPQYPIYLKGLSRDESVS